MLSEQNKERVSLQICNFHKSQQDENEIKGLEALGMRPTVCRSPHEIRPGALRNKQRERRASKYRI